MPLAIPFFIDIHVAWLYGGAILVDQGPRFGPANEPVDELVVPYGDALSNVIRIDWLTVWPGRMPGESSRRVRQETEWQALALAKARLKSLYLGKGCQQIASIVEGVVPAGLYGRLYENHCSAAGLGIYAKEETSFLCPIHMNLPTGKIVRLEGFEELLVVRPSLGGWKCHAKALVDVVGVPQPQAARTRVIWIAPHMYQQT